MAPLGPVSASPATGIERPLMQLRTFTTQDGREAEGRKLAQPNRVDLRMVHPLYCMAPRSRSHISDAKD